MHQPIVYPVQDDRLRTDTVAQRSHANRLAMQHTLLDAILRAVRQFSGSYLQTHTPKQSPTAHATHQTYRHFRLLP